MLSQADNINFSTQRALKYGVYIYVNLDKKINVQVHAVHKYCTNKIVKRLGLGLGTWDLGLGPGTWDLGPGTWE